MDDSRAALIKAYNAVRERYNKLRLHHRQLLKDRTCSQCRQKLNASIQMERSSERQTTSVISQKLSSDATEIREICDQMKQLVEAGQVADGACTIYSIIPRLQNVASRMATNTIFDEQQESLLDASVSEVLLSSAMLSKHRSEDSAAGLLQSQQGRISANAAETCEDLAASKTCEASEDKNFTTGKLYKYILHHFTAVKLSCMQLHLRELCPKALFAL